MIDSLEAALVLRARLLDTTGLPTLIGYDNVDVEPEVGQSYVTEQFVPATTSIMTFPANGGQVEETGLYVVTWYGVAGRDVKAIREGTQAVLSMFAPGTAFTLPSGHLRIRGDFGPQAGQIRRIEGGWASCTITIPWLARSTNTVAA
jgi:hypothetical protein